jgi:hypothetical protein
MGEAVKSSITITPEASQGMALASLCPEIRSIVEPTISIAAKRCAEGVGAPGWLDMKFDPVNGEERDASMQFYRKDRIYGWIQGRALESFAAHLRWAEAMPGYLAFSMDTVRAAADRLYRTIMGTCFLPGAATVSAAFAMDPSGVPLGRDYGTEATTLTQLFILRGLLAYASYADRREDAERIAAALRKAVDASLRGECLDDQMKFESFGGEAYDEGRKGYEGQMISIGACELLIAHSRDRKDAERGLRCVSEVLASFLLRREDGQPYIVDALDRAGVPQRDAGRLTINPGHSIEFAGLALQFMRHASSMGLDLSAGSREKAEEIADMKAILQSVAFGCDCAGRAPHGGIVRSVDAETLEVLNGACPWWSSFEAARTFGEIYADSRDETIKERCLAIIRSYLRCIKDVYIAPSKLGIPVQTVSEDGKILAIIPATPDIDAGYHTGIPLLDLYEIAGASGGVRCGAAERRLSQRLGVRLQGHIARNKPAEGELDPLHVRCLWIESARSRALFLSADVLEFSGIWAESLMERVAHRFHLPADSIFLMATHTHTAPCAIDLGMISAEPDFLDELSEAVLEVIEQAKAALEPSILLTEASAVSGVGINRRARDPASGKIAMRPNPSGENDETIQCVFVFGQQGGLRSLLFNVAVHPTTLGVSIYKISADYPGCAASLIERECGGGVIAIPVQGACGDIRPRVLSADGKEFAEGAAGDVARIGAAVADAVRRALNEAVARQSAGKLPEIGGAELAVISRFAELPFAAIPGCDELHRIELEAQREIERLEVREHEAGGGFAESHENQALAAQTYVAWAREMRKKLFAPDGSCIGAAGIRARFSLCSLGPSLLFFSIPGEAFCAIGKELKRLGKPAATMVCGYCAGTVGYIPTKAAFSEGGYEVETAYRYYGQPAPLAPGAEELIYSLFKEMLQEVTTCRR